MSARFYFRGFARLQHLEDFLRARIQVIADCFIPSGRYDLVARIHTTRTRSDLKRPKYLCEVKLEGIVHTAQKKAMAAGIVWELSGVRDCMNLIEIVDPPLARLRVTNEAMQKMLLSGTDSLSCRQMGIAV